MNFKQKREAFEGHCGGQNALKYLNEMQDKRLEDDPYRQPNCVCGQKTKRVFKVGVKGSFSHHWVGTCCISHYLDTSSFGGVYGVKQRSYKDFAKAIKEVIPSEILDTTQWKEIFDGLNCSIIKTNESKDLIEKVLGVSVRFKTRESKRIEQWEKNAKGRGHTFEDYTEFMECLGKWTN